MASIRILVVEDFLPFRRLICATLGKKPDIEIIAEVSDGQEAVRKAEELQPDLILLDIGLRTLNGIAAARQIRQLVPDSKIIFVTQESSEDVVQEALSTGALGYVAKTTMNGSLQAAVDAALAGKQFISKNLMHLGSG
jgi:DNA-binding NarL/FixJ family response regulator